MPFWLIKLFIYIAKQPQRQQKTKSKARTRFSHCLSIWCEKTFCESTKFAENRFLQTIVDVFGFVVVSFFFRLQFLHATHNFVTFNSFFAHLIYSRGINIWITFLHFFKFYFYSFKCFFRRTAQWRFELKWAKKTTDSEPLVVLGGNFF